MSQAGGSSINEFFKTFVLNFAATFKDEYIKIHSGDRLKLAMDVYAK